MQHSKPQTSKVNTAIGAVPEKTHSVKNPIRAASKDTSGTASGMVGNCGKVAWGPINPKGSK